MEKKTLQKIKDEIAKQYGHVNWSAFRNHCFKDSISGSKDMEAMMDAVNILSQQQALKNASENAETKWITFTNNDYEVDKQSILNENNLVK